MKNALSFLFVLFTIVGFSQDNFPPPDSPYTVVYQENFDQHPTGQKPISLGDTILKTDSTSIVVNDLYSFGNYKEFTGSRLQLGDRTELMFTIGDVSEYDTIRVRLRFSNNGENAKFNNYDSTGNLISTWEMDVNNTPLSTKVVFDTILHSSEFNFKHLKFATHMNENSYYYSIQVYGRKDSVGTSIDKVTVVEDFRLYPNPNRGNFNVGFYSNEHFNDVATIYDITGQIVYEKDLEVIPGTNRLSFNYTLPKGMYFLRLRNDLSKFVIINSLLK